MHYKTKQGNMAYYYDILNSSDDEDIVQMINRRPKVFKPRRNYFEEQDDIEFKMRFRFRETNGYLIMQRNRTFIKISNK